MTTQKRWSIKDFLFLGIALAVMLSCNLPSSTPTSAPNIGATQAFMELQATQLAVQSQQSTLNAAMNAPTATQVPPSQTPIPTQTSQPTSTETPAPTSTIAPTQTPQPAATDTAVPTPTPTQGISMEEKIKKSNVLVFEDIWGYYPLAGDKRVNSAVNMMNFSGGRVINVGDALGDFKAHLNSSTPWDLIVVSAESRSGVKGEFWDYVQEQMHKKVAIIAEIWYLDDINQGRISPILSECGVSLHKDWGRGPNYDQLDYSILLLDTAHPVFNIPNKGISLVTPNIFWEKDAGDLYKLGAGGDATLLAGVYTSHKSDYGVLASCMQGRFMLMGFSTHDYRRDQTVPLWVNMMTYVLTNHYQAIQ